MHMLVNIIENDLAIAIDIKIVYLLPTWLFRKRFPIYLKKYNNV